MTPHDKDAAEREALSLAVIEHLGPQALSGGKMSVLEAFEKGWLARSDLTASEAMAKANAQPNDAVVAKMPDGSTAANVYEAFERGRQAAMRGPVSDDSFLARIARQQTVLAHTIEDAERYKQAAERVATLEQAIRSTLSWIESAHRPPVPETFPAGKMVSIRLHALADLHKALHGEYPAAPDVSNDYPKLCAEVMNSAPAQQDGGDTGTTSNTADVSGEMTACVRSPIASKSIISDSKVPPSPTGISDKGEGQ